MGQPLNGDLDKQQALFDAYTRLGSLRKAANEVGVSKSTAERWLKSVPKAAAPVIAQQQHIVEAAGTSLWDTRAVLEDSYRRLVNLVDKLEAGIQLVNVNGNDEYVTYTPPSTLVAAIKELREHGETSVKIAKLILEIDEIRTFQQAVLDTLAEADESLRQRALEKLRQRRALGLTRNGS